MMALRKHTYSNTYLKFHHQNWKFSDKNSDIFHISAQNIDCWYSLEYRGGSNEYPQSMFLKRNREIYVYPCKPQFYYIKAGFKWVKIIWVCFRDRQTVYSQIRRNTDRGVWSGSTLFVLNYRNFYEIK